MSGTGGRRSPLPAARNFTDLRAAVTALERILKAVAKNPPGGTSRLLFHGVSQQDALDLEALGAQMVGLLDNAHGIAKNRDAINLINAIEQYVVAIRAKFGIDLNDADYAGKKDEIKARVYAALGQLVGTNDFIELVFKESSLFQTPDVANDFQQLRDEVNADDYEGLKRVLPGILHSKLIEAVKSDVGVGRPIARTPTPPVGDVGGAAELHDDDNPDDPVPGSASEAQLRGSKQALHGVKKAHTAAVISSANTMRDLFEAKTARQSNKTQPSREAKARWRNAQERLNQWYGYRATEAEANYSVDSGNVVCTVQHTIGDDSTRDQLFTVTPRNDINKRVVLNCHAEAVIEPGLTTGYMDLHQEGVYSTLQQSRYLITDSLREMCSDPRFAGKPAIVFRVHLTDDSFPVIPKPSKAPSTNEDAIRLISMAVMAFNADPRVVVKLLPQEYNFLVSKGSMPEVNKFLTFYTEDLFNKVNNRPIHKFNAAEVSALRNQYEAAYVHRDVLANKIR